MTDGAGSSTRSCGLQRRLQGRRSRSCAWPTPSSCRPTMRRGACTGGLQPAKPGGGRVRLRVTGEMCRLLKAIYNPSDFFFIHFDGLHVKSDVAEDLENKNAFQVCCSGGPGRVRSSLVGRKCRCWNADTRTLQAILKLCEVYTRNGNMKVGFQVQHLSFRNIPAAMPPLDSIWPTHLHICFFGCEFRYTRELHRSGLRCWNTG